MDALYHAETRLKKLAASAGCPAMPEAVAEGKCFGDWILLPLLCRPEAAPLREAGRHRRGRAVYGRYQPMAGGFA